MQQLSAVTGASCLDPENSSVMIALHRAPCYNERKNLQKGKVRHLNIGEKIRSARLEMGMSQRQLCGDRITRNMLSQIENGSASPSLQTLQMLAQRLHRPVGYFFGEEAAEPENRKTADQAWSAFQAGKTLEAARILDDRHRRDLGEFPDVAVLKVLVLLELAEQAIAENRTPYAREMLRWIEQEPCRIPELRRRALLLQGSLEGQKAAPIASQLPSLDSELRLRARGALEQGKLSRAAELLEAAEDHTSPDWAMLRGKVFLEQGRFQDAARCFHLAEQSYPRETAPWLERCYRELEDFKQAYFYACRQKERSI